MKNFDVKSKNFRNERKFEITPFEYLTKGIQNLNLKLFSKSLAIFKAGQSKTKGRRIVAKSSKIVTSKG
jgi:hypothetical protein